MQKPLPLWPQMKTKEIENRRGSSHREQEHPNLNSTMRQSNLPPHSLIVKETLEPAFSLWVFTLHKRELQCQCCASAFPGTTDGTTSSTEKPPGTGQHRQHRSSHSCSQQKRNSNGVVPKKPTAKIHWKKIPGGQLEVFKPLQYSASLGGAKPLHSTIVMLAGTSVLNWQLKLIANELTAKPTSCFSY